MNHRPFLIIVSALMLALCGCSTDNLPDPESASIAFRNYKQAIETQAWNTAFSSFSPESKDFVIFELFFTSAVARDPELEAICDNYLDEAKLDSYPKDSNLNVKQRRHMIASCVDDQPGFFNEAMTHVAKKKKAWPELGEFRVKDQGATAMIYCQTTVSVSSVAGTPENPEANRITEDVTMEEQYHLNKVDGRWLITIPGTTKRLDPTD